MQLMINPREDKFLLSLSKDEVKSKYELLVSSCASWETGIMLRLVPVEVIIHPGIKAEMYPRSD